MEAVRRELCPMTVQVRFMGDLPALLGTRKLELPMPPDTTVGDMLAVLSECYGDDFHSRVFCSPGMLRQAMLIFVDGENIKERGGLASTLGNGEVEVILLPMFGGG